MKIYSTIIALLLTSTITFSQTPLHRSGNNEWNPDSLGNQRMIVSYNGIGTVAKISIEWRRRDKNPEEKKIIVVDESSGKIISNVKTTTVSNEKGEIYFEPISGKGIYYLYYLPNRNAGSTYYPNSAYLKPEKTAENYWLSGLDEKMPVNTTVEAMEGVDDFNVFTEMEIIATKAETQTLQKKYRNNAFLVFPESRMLPVRMTDRLPYKWIHSGPSYKFAAEVSKGEHFSFQLGVYALKNVEQLTINLSELVTASGAKIPASALSCLNTTGVQYDASTFKKTINIKAGTIQSLWCLLDVPVGTEPGTYSGKATILTDNNKPVTIQLKITVSSATLADGGISEPEKQTRLHWLNSTLAQENTVVKPYTPLQTENKSISLLGRKLTLTSEGLPAQIESYFTKEMTALKTTPENILAAPFQFNVVTKEKTQQTWTNKKFAFTTQSAGTVAWMATNTTPGLNMDLDGSIEFDGFVKYTIKLTATDNITLNDIALMMPFTKEAATYMMGLGKKGGYRPGYYKWNWNVATKNQDGAWLGNINKGLQYSLRDEHYSRPLNTNFYLQKPLLLPQSWGNDNKGGIEIKENENEVIVNNFSGDRILKKGETVFFNFTLLITPFHTIDTDFQWQTKFYHKYSPIADVLKAGSTVINIHHANTINPWINYPFIEWKKMKDYIDSAHAQGLKVKIYNTVREVSNRAYETFPMRSLGHEIYSVGPGGGYSWLQEHLGDDYIAAWFVPAIKDAAVINSGMSRWHNYYVEGMNWLVNHVGIDGIYLDDVAFDRITMKRIKRVLTQNNKPGIIDLHSANQFNKKDGYNNSGNLYLEHFPYIDRLWFGEYFDYENNSPDFFLTEISGLPFGLMGEMLEKGGNPWRGMLYGMTNRMPYDGNDPGPIWKVWDAFGMLGSEMLGYWSDKNPVKTNNSNVLVTTYVKEKSALLSVASWDSTDVKVNLSVNWEQLGIDPAKAIINKPAIKDLQTEENNISINNLSVAYGKGAILIIKERD